MQSKSNKRGLIASFGLCTVLLATVAGTSCGGSKGSGFSGTGGSSSGANGDEGGFGDDGSITCFGQCSVVNVDSSVGASGGTPIKMDAGVSIDDCTGSSVGAATVTSLEAGGTLDPAMKWLYPYDQTIFPGGIIAPVLQWTPQSGGADAVYV